MKKGFWILLLMGVVGFASMGCVIRMGNVPSQHSENF